MAKTSATDTSVHVSAIQAITDGYQKRAEANINIGQGLAKLALGRLRGAQTPEQIQAAVESFSEAMLHW